MKIEAPYFDGDFVVYPDGRRLLRVSGSDDLDPSTDQPNPETPEGGQAAQEPEPFSENFDPATLPEELRPAYNQLRADYTRKTQSVAEQRREIEGRQALYEDLESDDPTRQARALRYLGYDVPEAGPETPDENLSPTSNETERQLAAALGRLDRIEQVEQNRSVQAQAQAEEAAFVDDLDSQFTALEQKLGRDLSDKEIRALTNQAVADLDESTGRANVDGAYEFLFGDVLAEHRTQYAQRKRTAVPAPAGRPGEKQPDLKDDNVRRSLMAQVIEAGDDEAL